MDDNKSIDSGDCYENAELFTIMNENEKVDHIRDLWMKSFSKAKGGARVLRFANDLSNKIVKFGVTKKLEELELE